MSQSERRTQADRSEATRALLVRAATEVLIERGWAATTAVEVCDRAKVTRGALVHHFKSLPALLAATLASIYSDFQQHFREPGTVEQSIDAVWRVVSDRNFKAVMEAWWAAANDHELGQTLGPVISDFAELVSPTNLPPALNRADVRAFTLQSRETMIGLAFGRATRHGHPLPHEASVLKRLRADAARLDLAAPA